MNNKELILITGTQNRHLSVASKVIENYDVIWIRYNRKLVPQASKMNSLFLKNHLQSLVSDEQEAIGEFNLKSIELNSNIKEIIDVNGVEEFNEKSYGLINKNKIKANATLIYGCGIIKEKLMSKLPNPLINIHGGISPYFKGSSTLLYALALCQPELLGMTVHEIDSGIDSGDIYCHLIPELEIGMTPTKMFASCQKVLIEKISTVILNIIDSQLNSFKQSQYGRTFMERDYREQILKTIYHMYKVGMYDESINNLDNLRKKYKLKIC